MQGLASTSRHTNPLVQYAEQEITTMQMLGRKLAQWLQNGFQSERLLPGLASGMLMGISEVMVSLSLGSLNFSGALAPLSPLRDRDRTVHRRGHNDWHLAHQFGAGCNSTTKT